VSHPLEAEGEAIRIWPVDPGRVLDIGSLPYSTRDELAWISSS
jgi:hypothetical protein